MVTVTIDGDRMIMDWRETDVVAAGPVNLPLGGTIAVCRLVVKALTTPDNPVCDNRVVVFPGTDRERFVGVSNTAFEPGEAIVNLTGGGGGWGDPFLREPAAVATDVRLGFVSVLAARRDYGVVLDPVTFVIDDDATSTLRTMRTVTAWS